MIDHKQQALHQIDQIYQTLEKTITHLIPANRMIATGIFVGLIQA